MILKIINRGSTPLLTYEVLKGSGQACKNVTQTLMSANCPMILRTFGRQKKTFNSESKSTMTGLRVNTSLKWAARRFNQQQQAIFASVLLTLTSL